MQKQQIIQYCLAALALAAAPALYAGPIYQVQVNTGSAAGSDILLSVSLGAMGNPDPLTAKVGGFSGAAAFTLDNTYSSGVSGANPYTLQTNDWLTLDVAHLGSLLSFWVAFSGPAIDSPSSTWDTTTLAVWLLDKEGNSLNRVSSGDPSLVLEVGGGTVGVQPESLQDPNVQFGSSVPEPGTSTFLAVGLGVAVLFFRRRLA